MSLSRQQLTLIGIFALFIGPVLLVMMMRSSWWQYQPSGMKNRGQLVQPPVHLELDQAQVSAGKWLILDVLDDPCEQACVDNVTALRQIHRATGRRGEHLAIALLTADPVEPGLRSSLEMIYPNFNFVDDSRQTALTTLAEVNARIEAGPGEIHTYVLDPMGNVILAYRAGANPADIHTDLKRLLKLSDQEGK